MRRAICVPIIVGVGSCYTPSPSEQLGCSETDRCPSGQACDVVFDVCTSVPLCKPPPIVDPFDVEPLCSGWGVQFGQAAVAIANGVISISPITTRANSGGCTAAVAMPYGPEGMFVEVAEVLPRGFTVLTLGQSRVPAIRTIGGRLVLGEYPAGPDVASVPYDPIAMRWWRLRPARDRASSIGEYSADGIAWTELGVVEIAAPDTATIELAAGVDDIDPAPGTATIAGLGVCAPGTRAP